MNNYNHNFDQFSNLDVNNPAPRCPVTLLLDVSGSMSGQPINELNAGLRQFLEETARDEAASRSVELEVITFDSQADIAMPFTPIADVDQNFPPLQATGCTAMGAALDLAYQELKARRKLYRNSGISGYRPWVVLMTDGGPNDSWETPAAKMRELGEKGKIQYLGIEIGDGADHDTMCRIMPSNSQPVKLRGMQFKNFFRWLSDSMRSVSSSAVSDQNNIQFQPITDWAEL